ncbi:ArnT family glycosyltransferase [Pelagovum pacificum]|uniref:Glycosyltransferase RgtA/B/C/D-like domain-containing protein n=1 Tax=Pelagovum pacificum TaxID=2588711 RepID=A0A5C5G8W9_9RHOB|nr:hypothetical protein [Pelagovum pacificum]QQA45091.1 hypothetical protein I8N54_19930 [Pelagovum pacificum]TNY30535.1 hypothetical protein FHY64_19615 [Pelagovum pacificum]
MSAALHRAWALVVRYPIWTGLLLIALQTLLVLNGHWLWFSDEVRYAEVYSNLVSDGHWVVLRLNGEPYPDKPPVFFLLVRALDLIPGVGMPHVLYLASAVSAGLLLAALVSLGRAVGVGREGRAGGVLVLLALPAMSLLLHYVRMDLLFTALMIWAQAAFYRHYIGGKPASVAYGGYALAGLAILVKGPLGLLLPLAAVALPALVRGQWRRLVSLTTLLGLLVALAVVSLWGVGIVAVEGWDFLMGDILGQQVVARAVDTFHHSEPVTFYFWMLPLLLMPWTGMVAGLRGSSFRATWAGTEPVSALALGALATFAVLSSLDGKVGVYVLPILAQLALLFGLLLTSAPQRAARIGVALLFVLLGGVIASLPAWTEGTGWGASLLCGLLLIAAALPLVSRLPGGPALSATAGLMALWSLALAAFLLPALNETMSTRQPAELLGQGAEEGATPVAYRTYPGIFSYYAGRDVVQVDEAEAMQAMIDSGEPLVVAARRRHWEQLDAPGFEELYARELIGAGGEYVVMRRE